jgi:hypothetical protein
MRIKQTPEALAQIEAMIQQLKTSITEGEALLERNALVGQGYVCVIGDMSMGITVMSREFRLRPLTGSLAGILHMTQEDATRRADSWNQHVTNLGEAFKHCAVRPVHFRVAVEGLLASQRQLLADMELALGDAAPAAETMPENGWVVVSRAQAPHRWLGKLDGVTWEWTADRHLAWEFMESAGAEIIARENGGVVVEG